MVSYPGTFGKISPACRGNSPQARTADSSSTNAVNFSSARRTKRFPLTQDRARIVFDCQTTNDPAMMPPTHDVHSDVPQRDYLTPCAAHYLGAESSISCQGKAAHCECADAARDTIAKLIPDRAQTLPVSPALADPDCASSHLCHERLESRFQPKHPHL